MGDLKQTSGRRGATTRTLLVVTALIAVVALSAALIACGGGSSVAGTYKFDSGSFKQMAMFKLTLNDDETYKLAGPNPLGGEDVTINGAYTIDGDKISLKDDKGVESEVGTVEGDKLVFSELTWVKE